MIAARLAFLLLLPFYCLAQPLAPSKYFPIKRGINLSHWLSQSKKRGDERAAYITEQDFKELRAAGFDHVRLPFDEVQLWDSLGHPLPDGFALLHQGIGWALKYNLRVVADLHIIRAHYFNAKENKLWTDPAATTHFLDLWRQLSAELKKYPTDKVAYEFMNEPVAPRAELWNTLIAKTHAMLRELEPKRVLVIGSNMWQDAHTFPQLQIPQNDPYILLSFHCYHPMALTHYKASWVAPLGKYEGPIQYPGLVVKPEDAASYPTDVQKAVQDMGGKYTIQTLDSLINVAVTVARKNKLPLYCGEFGCRTIVDANLRLAWTRDMISVFNKYNIAWAMWDYKGGFALRLQNGQIDPALLITLTKSGGPNAMPQTEK